MKSNYEIRKGMEDYVKWIGGEIRPKEDSTIMKILAIVLFFNRKFMSYTTVIKNVVYVPKKFINTPKEEIDNYMHFIYAQVLAHEVVHIWDTKERGQLSVTISYLLPQLFAIPALLAFGAFWNIHMLWFLVMLVFLAPLPSPGRKNFEMRGYAMSMAFEIWYNEKQSQTLYELEPPNWIIKQFTGWGYYKMFPFHNAIAEELVFWLHMIKRDKLSEKIKVADDIKRIVTGVA